MEITFYHFFLSPLLISDNYIEYLYRRRFSHKKISLTCRYQRLSWACMTGQTPPGACSLWSPPHLRLSLNPGKGYGKIWQGQNLWAGGMREKDRMLVGKDEVRNERKGNNRRRGNWNCKAFRRKGMFNIQSLVFQVTVFLNTLRLWCGSGLPWKPHLGIEKGVQQHVVGLQVQMEERRSQTVEEVYT